MKFQLQCVCGRTIEKETKTDTSISCEMCGAMYAVTITQIADSKVLEESDD